MNLRKFNQHAKWHLDSKRWVCSSLEPVEPMANIPVVDLELDSTSADHLLLGKHMAKTLGSTEAPSTLRAMPGASTHTTPLAKKPPATTLSAGTSEWVKPTLRRLPIFTVSPSVEKCLAASSSHVSKLEIWLGFLLFTKKRPIT